MKPTVSTNSDIDLTLADEAELRRIQAKIKRLSRANKPYDKLQQRLEQIVSEGPEKLALRKASLPTPRFDDALPIAEHRDEIAKLIQENQVVVLAGETGSGKTTQLPKLCLGLGLGAKGIIGHTQPRRLAARSVASRIAEELGESIGKTVGYQIRFSDETSDDTAIKLMTDGILLAEIARDPMLSAYEVIIVDEAHERSLNIDFLLGYLKRLTKRRPDLKIIITSATIDVERFSKHFNNAPTIEVSGRTYPVEILYRPLLTEDADSADLSMYDGIVEAIESIEDIERESGRERNGDVLVFLPGEREIRETHKRLKHASLRHMEVLPLYSRLSANEQNKIFQPHKGRRVILSTNVAETSLTVPGIVYVIDPGLARVSRYSYRSKVQRLPIEAISQASANQRAGRCGRVAPGVCIRLYSEEDFLARPEFTEAEIKRSNLSAVIMQMIHLGLGDISQFEFVDAPDRRLINDGFKRLEELGAVNKKGDKFTKIGRQLSKLPIDPHLARMLYEAHDLGALKEVLVIVSAMSIQDPRERPAEKQQAADQKHQQWQHEQSDFLSYWNLWQTWEQWQADHSQNQLRKLAKQNYLSYLRMREWRDIHHQLHNLTRALKWKRNTSEASFDAIHQSITAGLLGNIAQKETKDEYAGARGRRFHIFPGSTLKKKRPNWLVAGMLLETSRLFAHTVASIEPEWLLRLAKHLLKIEHYEPFYSIKQGRVMAYQRSTLYGLVIEDKKRVPFDHHDIKVAREIFIRECLVAEQYKGKGKFYAKNLNLKLSLTKLEDKTRRRDLLVEDEAIYEFYDERVPRDVADLVSFESWRVQVEEKDKDALVMQSHHLEAKQLQLQPGQFPNKIRYGGMELKLRYRFEPGHKADGVSVVAPLGILPSLSQGALDWVVPGILRDKCIALVKALPKQYRKHFVPVPDYVDRVLLRPLDKSRPLTEVLGNELKFLASVSIPDDVWSVEALEDYYRMNIQVVDNRQKIIAQGRDLASLREQLQSRIDKALSSAESDESLDEEIQTWNFGSLPTQKVVSKAGVKVTAYPALVDRKSVTALKLFDSLEQATAHGIRGVSRLALLQLTDAVKQAKKDLFNDNQTKLALSSVCPRDQLIDDVLMVASREVFNWKELPRSEAEFKDRLAQNKVNFLLEVNQLAGVVSKILKDYAQLRKVLSKANSLTLTFAVNDISQQWKWLLTPGFVWRTPNHWLLQYERYLKASHKRLDQIQGKTHKDKANQDTLLSYFVPVIERLDADDYLLWETSRDLVEVRFMMEEWRIQLFAQPMKSLFPVSEKRVKLAIEALS